MILFGTNDVRINAYMPYELGVSKNPESGFKIEIRQRYFHVLQLPIIPIKKTWHIRKGAHLSKMPEPYKLHIDRRKARAWTPLFTCTGAILIMMAALAYFGVQEIKRQQAKSRFVVQTPNTISYKK